MIPQTLSSRPVSCELCDNCSQAVLFRGPLTTSKNGALTSNGCHEVLDKQTGNRFFESYARFLESSCPACVLEHFDSGRLLYSFTVLAKYKLFFITRLCFGRCICIFYSPFDRRRARRRVEAAALTGAVSLRLPLRNVV
jgi:hypothetical protein